jgi:hypothetical protein
MYTIIIERVGTRENGKASYRVFDSLFYNTPLIVNWAKGWKLFEIQSAKPYQRGCFINPAKTLRESGLMR